MLIRLIGLFLLFLALWVSRGAEKLLRSAWRHPSHEKHVGRLQNRFFTLLTHLQHRQTDPLTGIGTHSLAHHEIQKLIAADRAFLVIRLSIDNINRINKTLGHDIGDQLLVALTHRLVRLQYHHGRLYRLCGNEFLLLVAPPFVNNTLLERLREQLSQPLKLSGTSLIPTISMAVLQSPDNGRDAHQLLHRSSIALIQARHSREGFHVYQSGLDHRHAREKQLLGDLVDAVQDQQLRVVYQPKIRLDSGDVTGFEALLQWQHPTLGLLYPDEFLPLAVHSGHMALIGQWLIDQVMDHMAAWQTSGHALQIAINLSAVDLDDPQLARKLLAGLHRRHIAPTQLMLEITEQMMMLDPESVALLLEKLRKEGVTIAIDDFGTGYSSLTQLRRLPLDVLKIDKSFVMNLTKQHEDATIVHSSIALAHDFGLEVVAEGVETHEQLALLTKAGCNQAQGYLIARPMDVGHVLDWLEQYREATPPNFAPT
ncbi:putative bifunctional diguanylate cyclase/phosphodiesterase [Halomonas sp. M20]|uniref:putative bifunctional diguanylate cyclase/phosphodiesterase n=1 Tax=Halomonas sp. M20 TaxID=2763264 RepID=UPI001D0ABD1F|nr:bifunctional diguanylate cyclase/phosphodiesterase [Halomonas sp. M20]